MKEYKYAVINPDIDTVMAIAEFDNIETMDGLSYPDEWNQYINIKGRTETIEVGMKYNPESNTFYYA